MVNLTLAMYIITFSFSFYFIFAISHFALESTYSYENKNLTSETGTMSSTDPYSDCNYDTTNVNASVSSLDIKLNNNANEGYNNQTKNNSSQVELVFNEKSVILDLGCDPTIWSIDLLWDEATKLQHNYAIEIADSNNITTNKIHASTNIAQDNQFSSIEAESSLGRYIKVTLNDTENMTIHNLRHIILNIYHPDVREKRTDIEIWNEYDNEYPDTISISNFTHTVNPESIFKIISGDDDAVLNPNFVLPKEPILDIGLRNVISFGINYSHIEGAASKMEAKDDIGNIREVPIFDLKQLSYNDFKNSTLGLKTFYFLPYLTYSDNPLDTKTPDSYYLENRSLPFINKTLTEGLSANLTISFAPDSETFVYYKTKVSITN